jgi:hypothetical protein
VAAETIRPGTPGRGRSPALASHGRCTKPLEDLFGIRLGFKPAPGSGYAGPGIGEQLRAARASVDRQAEFDRAAWIEI